MSPNSSSGTVSQLGGPTFRVLNRKFQTVSQRSKFMGFVNLLCDPFDFLINAHKFGAMNSV